MIPELGPLRGGTPALVFRGGTAAAAASAAAASVAAATVGTSTAA
jgi:hypothetical protein